MYDRRRAIFGSVSAGLCLGCGSSYGRDYPTKPVRVIVPFAVGGGTDLIARGVLRWMGESMSATFIIDNRSGANANIGNDIAAHSMPDGYTLLMTSSALSVNPGLYKNLSYDSVKDFAPIGLAAYVPLTLVVNKSLGVQNLQQFVDLAKSGRPINYGSAGTGNVTHLAMEQLKLLAKINLQHVPYRGTSPALQDLLGNQIQAMWGTSPPTVPLILDGRVIALAVGGQKRLKIIPDVPTIAELGYPDMNAASWFGLLAPAGTPKHIVAELSREMKKAMADQKLIDLLTVEGAEPGGNTPEEFSTMIKDELVKWRSVIEAAGIERQ